jgi:hypothetical protein
MSDSTGKNLNRQSLVGRKALHPGLHDGVHRRYPLNGRRTSRQGFGGRRAHTLEGQGRPRMDVTRRMNRTVASTDRAKALATHLHEADPSAA